MVASHIDSGACSEAEQGNRHFFNVVFFPPLLMKQKQTQNLFFAVVMQTLQSLLACRCALFNPCTVTETKLLAAIIT